MDISAYRATTRLGDLQRHRGRRPERPSRRPGCFIMRPQLKAAYREMGDCHLFLEFLIPRRGRRVDAIILHRGIIFVVEYKVGEDVFLHKSLNQVFGYVLDLTNFHESSHAARVVPILVATEPAETLTSTAWAKDAVMSPIATNAEGLVQVIRGVAATLDESALDPITWAVGRYEPTPTMWRQHRHSIAGTV